MAGKVFFSVTMSLDGFIAPESLGDLMGQQWMELQQWMFPQRFILEYVNAGLIDEFSIALSPVLFGSGIRLFEGVDAGRVALEPVRAEPTQRVTNLTYAVRER